MPLFLPRILFFILIGLVSLFSSFNVRAGQWIETFDIAGQPLEIGQGWDSQREQPTPGRCIIFSPIQARGQVSSVVIEEVDDASELAESLDISASGTANYLAGSTNISGQFIAKSKVSSTNKNYSLQAQVRNGLLSVGPYSPSGPVRYNFPALNEHGPDKLSWTERLTYPGLDNEYHQIQLTDQALELLAKKNGQQEFLRYCGDGYVASISSGAEVHVLISHESQSAETNQHIEAHLQSSYGMGSITGDVKSDIDETLATSNLKYHFIQMGGGEGILPIQQDDLAAKLHDLQAEALRAPVFYELGAASYQGLINWPDIDINNPPLRDTTEKLVELYLDITSLYTTYVDVWNQRDAHAIVAYRHRQSMDRLSQCARTIQDVIALRQQNTANLYQSQHEKVEPVLQSSTQACPGLLPATLTAADNTLETQAAMLADHYKRDWLVQFKLDLPLPQSQSMLSEKRTAEEIVERYLAKSARRACARDPSSNDCLSEQALADYVQYVPPKKLIIDKARTVKSAYQQKCWAMRSENGELIMVLDNCKQRDWNFSLSASGSMQINEFCLIKDKYPFADGSHKVITIRCNDVSNDEKYRWHIDSLGRICGAAGKSAPDSCKKQQCLSIQDDSDVLALKKCSTSDMQQRWYSEARKIN